MESFCPLCAKSGIKRRLKAFQINLEEAVWSCESEECPWPIGYEELTFFNRSILCNWEKPGSAKEDVPTLMELSLYTPPVTPGGELSKESTEIASTDHLSNPPVEDKIELLPQFIASKESTSSNKLSQFESMKLESINSTEENGPSVMNEQIAGISIFRTLPKITNIEKTNINITMVSNSSEHCDNKEIQEHECLHMNVMNTLKNFDASGCMELNMQYKTEGKQSESGKLQSDAIVNSVETSFGMETSETGKTLVDVDVTNSSNTLNESIGNNFDGEITTLLEDIFNNSDSHIPANINDDWLNSLIS